MVKRGTSGIGCKISAYRLLNDAVDVSRRSNLTSLIIRQSQMNPKPDLVDRQQRVNALAADLKRTDSSARRSSCSCPQRQDARGSSNAHTCTQRAKLTKACISPAAGPFDRSILLERGEQCQPQSMFCLSPSLIAVALTSSADDLS